MSYEVQRITGDARLAMRLAELDERGREVVHMAQHGDVHGSPCWVVVSREAQPALAVAIPTPALEPEQPLEDLSRRARRRR